MQKRTIEIALANGFTYHESIEIFRKGRCQIERNGSGPGYHVYCFSHVFGTPDNCLVRDVWVKGIHKAIEAANDFNRGYFQRPQ